MLPFSASSSDKEAIYELLMAASSFLDEGKFVDWLAVFSEDAQYEMLFQSAEIGGIDDYLLKLDKPGLAKMIHLLPNHVVDLAKRLHCTSNIVITLNGGTAQSRSNFNIFRTADGGKTTLYAVGHSEDVLVKEGSRWLFSKRRVVLDTRMLETHTHIPLQ
jgi:3-phenylpropionate/cinnamic acid dioxygenase small subunit